MNYKIATLEDDDLIRGTVKLSLERNGFRVHSYADGEILLNSLSNEPVDLFVLDVKLPGMSGLEVLKALRGSEIHGAVPVLMLTVQSQVHDKINALDGGADDYLVKPFNMDELIARVNALIRRSHGKRTVPSSHMLVIGGHKVNLSTRECETNRGRHVLSEKEARLLGFFSRHPGQTLRRADILEEVWGMDVSPTPRTIDNFVLKFRKLFEENPETPKHFLSVRNQGYRFEK